MDHPDAAGFQNSLHFRPDGQHIVVRIQTPVGAMLRINAVRRAGIALRGVGVDDQHRWRFLRQPCQG